MDVDFEGLDFEGEDEDAFEGPDAYPEASDDEWETENSSSNVYESDWHDGPLFGWLLSAHFLRPEFAIPDHIPTETEDEESDTDLNHPAAMPQKAGMELLMSGQFGSIGNQIRSRRKQINTIKHLTDRTRLRMPTYKEDVASHLIPNTNGTIVGVYPSNVYCGRFSADASVYYTGDQDFLLHIYDANGPRISPLFQSDNWGFYGHTTSMKVLSRIRGIEGRWTITDCHLSPNNERMIYSSLTPIVHMTSTRDTHPVQIPINFADTRPSTGLEYRSGIWSCLFSADGREVIAGSTGNVFAYDLGANRRTMKISAHSGDVNSCCLADSESSNVIISGSDDSFVKIWDRRARASPTGVLVGHTEGITCVSAKGDGRYVISNGKDQNLKLWDLRKIRSNTEFRALEHDSYQVPNFDYRYHPYPTWARQTHPQDCSVMTYRGHAIATTLIRCYFSPAETTGSQYIYSGSEDGKIHIWSLDGRIVQVLDRSRSWPMAEDPSGAEPKGPAGRCGRCCVRDVSWSSQEPVLMSAAWASHQQPESTVARHEWKGLTKFRGVVEDWVESTTSRSR